MAEEAQQTQEAQSATEVESAQQPAAPAADDGRNVSYERFQEINKQAKAAQKQADEMAKRLQELEDRDKSEIERERTARERAESQLTETMSRLERQEKRGWLRSAASTQNFHDPQDADRIDLSGIESEADAAKAVKELAKSSQHLVRQEETRPEIGQVVKQGQQVQPGQEQEGPSDQEGEDFLNQLKAAADSGWTSSPGLLDR